MIGAGLNGEKGAIEDHVKGVGLVTTENLGADISTTSRLLSECAI